MNGKENVDPRRISGILKNSDNNTIYSMRSEADTTNSNRRVSFANQVTMLEINVVSQDHNRRQTIGHAPIEVDERSEGSVGSSSSSVHSVYDDQDLAPSMRASRGQEVENEDDDLPETHGDIDRQAYPLPPPPPPPPPPPALDELSDSDSDDLEADMEFTEPMTMKKHDDMEFTQNIGAVKVNPQTQPIQPEVEENEEEVTMEFTRPLPVIKHIGIQSKPDDSMEFTQPISKISPVVSTTNAADDTFQNDGSTMEMTQTLSHINRDHSLSTITEGDEVSSKSEEQEMETTQPLSTIQKPAEPASPESPDVFEDAKETTEEVSTMVNIPDLTKPGRSVETHSPHQEHTETTMVTEESSTSVSKDLENLTLVSPQKERVPVESNRSSLSFDVEVPIPSDLRNKRFSDMEDEQNHKVARLSETASVHTIPLADVSLEPISYPNYQNVKLSQFLNDLGIKFFDDIELDDVNNEELTKRLIDQEFEFNDYVKASSKLPLYSLYEFGNKDMSNTIVEGRKLYQSLSESILENNPRAFKDFYCSSEDEQDALRAEYSLIQEFCKFKARTTWCDWRSKSVETILVKLNDKYELLLSDKAKLDSNIKLINEEYSIQVNVLNNLKMKLTVLRTLQREFDSKPEEFAKLKSQLKDSKASIVKIKTQIEEQTAKLESVTSKLKDADLKINTLVKEVKRQQDFIDNNKKFSLNDIKVLNFNKQLLQEVTNVTVEKVDEGIALHYREFEVIVKADVKVTIKKRKLFNDWMYDHIVASIEAISEISTLDKCRKIKTIVDKFVKLDKEIFKISIKLPLTNESNSNESNSQLGFKVKLFKSGQYKVVLTFKSSFDSIIADDVFKFDLTYDVSKTASPVEVDQILKELKTQCHIPNEVLTNLVVTV